MYGILCTFLTWVTISFPLLGKFFTIISSNTFSDLFSFFSSSLTPIIQMLAHLMSQEFLMLPSSVFILLFELLPPLYLLTHVSVLPQLFCYWFHLVNFSFQLLCFLSRIVVSSSRFLLNVSWIILNHASILFLRSWNLRIFQNYWNLIFTAISLHPFSGRLPIFPLFGLVYFDLASSSAI